MCVNFDRKSEGIAEFFKKLGNKATNPELGIVELGKKGARSTLFHGFGNDKLIAVGAIKDVIEHGVIINKTEKYKGKDYDRYILAGRGLIEGKDCYVSVVIKSYPNNKNLNSKFYLHEVTKIETDSHIMTSSQSSENLVSESVPESIKPQDNENVKLSIDEHFTDKYDEWDKKGGRFSFRVGTTSEVLQKLGVDDKNIWWDTSKILKIKNKHPEMTDDILKQVPNVLESPIIVMESYTVKGRLVLFGDVYDAKNNPVLVALELNPIGEGGKSLDIIKIASAYGKDSNLQHMIDKSNILYVEPNEKRTHTWLTGNGLQLPLPSSKYGFSDNIKSQNQGDVKYSVEKEAQAIKEASLPPTVEPHHKGAKTTDKLASSEMITSDNENVKLSIDEHFTDKYNDWNNNGGNYSIRVGTTSEVLQKLGVDDKNIWWDTSKILKIKNKHPEMTDDILKQVPNVLESPIIVMESYTVKGRLVLFGDVYDAKNNPVLVALELNPTDKGGKSLDIIKIASAYGKDSNLQHMIDKSNILYVEPNEKRTHTWLTSNGLQLPLPSFKYGFSDNIKSQNQGDVKYSVEKEAHSTLSIDEVLDSLEKEEKQKGKKNTTEYFPSMKEIMKQQWGNESEEYISKLMGDLQGSTKQADPGRIDMLTGKYIRAVLTANISSAIKQLSSYPLAAARVGWKATLAGLKHIRPGKHTPFLNRALPDSYKQSIPYDEIAKYTPILEYRKQGNNSREMAEISRYKGLIDSSGLVGHALDNLNLIEKLDVRMVEMNYWIAYEHVKGNMGISPDSKEFMPNVAKTLEDIINNMMPNSSVMQQGQILRSKNPVNRIFTICKSQVFCMVNAAMDASGEYNARLKDYKQAVSEFEKEQARTEVKVAKKQLARTYSSIIVSTAMTCGILMPLIAALFGKWDRYRDEDGNITPWSVGSRLLKDFGSELTGMFLFGDTVYNTVLSLVDKNEDFYGLSLPGVDTINDFITGIINIARSDTPEKLRKNISSLVGTLGMLTGLPTKNLMNLFQGACNHIENFTKYGGTPTVNDYGEVSMQMYANYCYDALIDGDKKKFAKLYSEWLKEKTSTGKQVDKSYINSKLKTELEDDTEIIAAGNAFFNGDLTAYENTVEKYADLGFDKTTVVKAINSIVSDLEDEQTTAKGLDKYGNEEESDREPELYNYSDAFDFLKNGDTESYEKVEKYLMEHKDKTKSEIKKLMQSASRTDSMFEKYISASKNNDADTTHTLYRQLLNIYGSESKFKSALKKYQDNVKKQQSK